MFGNRLISEDVLMRIGRRYVGFWERGVLSELRALTRGDVDSFRTTLLTFPTILGVSVDPNSPRTEGKRGDRSGKVDQLHAG